MGFDRSIIRRGVAILGMAALLVVLVQAVSPGASRPLTKKQAKKLFYTKKKADKRFVRRAQTQTGFSSCPGTAWVEESSDLEHTINAQRRHLKDTLSSDTGNLLCAAHLPHGATVTAVRLTVHDESNTERLSCTMNRVDLLTGQPSGMAGGIDELQTSDPDADGVMVLEDLSILNAEVDNERFAYVLDCLMNGFGNDIAIYGASVEYTVTGAQGAAS